LGPLPRAAFDAFLPGTPRHTRLVELARLFVGLDTGFAVNLVLARDAVPDLELGRGARLGWSSWLGQSRPRTRDAADPLFDARLQAG
ncbi:MAG TPA: type VI secretion system baseplate subunit TssG, partial [Acetobacteraceae bacterium]|nr:type VI secretion system baseplate subunit TssG [Acetobacteraceae bacterium]